MSRYTLLDRSRLKLKSLKDRRHLLTIDIIKKLQPVDFPLSEPLSPLIHVAKAIHRAREKDRARIMMMGAHVIRAGVQNYLIDLMKDGYITHLAVNGACVIHDFELALIGATTESVAEYIKIGQFGLWRELDAINHCITQAAIDGMGIGEAIGKMILTLDLPFKDISIFANAYLADIPITVHVGIGYDIVHELPSCDGASWGKTSYIDFLIFAESLKKLTNGVIMNFGSAVMAPEIFLKALAMARNIEQQAGKTIGNFTTCVCDKRRLPSNYHQEPDKGDPDYYFRPWKTMLVRTLDSGNSYYISADHAESIPALWTAIMESKNELA